MTMKTKREIARASVGLGTAALLGLATPACSEAEKKPTTEASAAEASPGRADAAVPQPTQESPAPQDAQADAGQAIAPSSDAPPPLRPDPFGGNNGYKSPTRYAVLDPASIVNV